MLQVRLMSFVEVAEKAGEHDAVWQPGQCGVIGTRQDAAWLSCRAIFGSRQRRTNVSVEAEGPERVAIAEDVHVALSRCRGRQALEGLLKPHLRGGLRVPS